MTNAHKIGLVAMPITESAVPIIPVIFCFLARAMMPKTSPIGETTPKNGTSDAPPNTIAKTPNTGIERLN